ncbi:MAG TPA: alcohol dehydrogenase catalytic domain-containing protein [Syntrophobacteria bacterium]|nr:alcohol dehydrogenase catalytic domain-containing protein [Syntrophobacteria bacterium]
MKAVLFQGGKVAVVEKPLPPAGRDEVLIRTVMAGICSTDRELLGGYHDFAGVPGHEFVGTVVQAPANPELIGRMVVADINCGCGGCSWCLAGNPRHCPERTTLGIRGRDGAFAEYLTMALRNLHLIDDSLAPDEAVFAEPLAAALEVGQQVHLRSQDRVVVLGDGTLGILVALTLRLSCPRLLLCGRYPEKLRVAEAQGVATRLVPSGRDAADICRELGYFDVVVEATGRAEGLASALELARPEGTVVVKTTAHEPAALSASNIVVRELTIVGSRCGDLELALLFLKNRWIDVNPLIEAIYPFAHFDQAWHHAGRRGTLKVLVSFE